MLKLKILQLDHMRTTAPQFLKALQDQHTHEIDLLVRESIQNSLDASRANQTLYMDFSIKDFSTEKFSRFLPEIENTLNARFSRNKQQALIITDKNTVGLTGPFHYEDGKMGNLLKLIYQIGEAQDQKGAGGSWGYGKTIFYRIGIGLVGFYSRILEDGEYKERLVIQLVEDKDNNKSNQCLYKKYKSKDIGIMWWGDLDDKNNSIPIVDHNIIKEVLASVDDQPYEGTETGTKIIIPFIDQNKYFNRHNDDEVQNLSDNYYDDFIDFISYSAQRWYAPRINNEYYGFGKKNNFIISFNNEVLKSEDQQPLFVLVRELYNSLFDEDSYKAAKELAPNSIIKIEDIVIRKSQGMSSGEAGKLVYGRFDYKDLGMGTIGSLNNPFVLFNIDRTSEKENDPIVFFTRQPGMIVNYESSSSWTAGLPASQKDEYFLAFFVLNSKDEFYFETKEGHVTLEEMVRNVEKSTHFEWNDFEYIYKNSQTKAPRVISRIKRRINDTLKREFAVETKTKSTNNTDKLSVMLGKEIMPKLGFGKAPSRQPSGPRIPTIKKLKHLTALFYYENISFVGNDFVTIPYTLTIESDKVKDIDIELIFRTDLKSMTIDKIEEELNRKSFIELSNITIDDEDNKYNINSKETIYGSKQRFTIEGDFNKHDNITGLLYISYQESLMELNFKVEAIEKDE